MPYLKCWNAKFNRYFGQFLNFYFMKECSYPGLKNCTSETSFLNWFHFVQERVKSNKEKKRN